jgi:acyl transferase domain-containing protein
VDTACSSGLTAVHLACHSLIDGESDLALAGGAAVIRGPAANQDGRTVNIATPSVTAQTAVYSGGRCRRRRQQHRHGRGARSRHPGG